MRPRKTASDRQVVLLNFAAMTQHGVILLLVGPMVPSIMSAFGIGESMAGVLLGMGSLGFMIGPLLAGAIIDRVNARAAMVVGLAVELLALMLFGASPVLVLAMAANLVLHFGASFVETTANVMPTLTRTKGSEHSVMNLVHMFFSVGAFAGPFLIGLYLGATGRWRPILFFTLIPTGALLLWALRIRFPARPESASGESKPSGRAAAKEIIAIVRMPHVAFGALTLLLYVGAEVGVSSWVVYYLQRKLELSAVASASGLSILWIAIMAGRYLNSVLGNRLSSGLLVTASGIAGFAGTVVFLFVQSLVAAYLVLIWIGLCLAGVFPNVMASLNNRVPQKTGTVTAVMSIGAAIGAGLFQWIVGLIAETVGLTAAFVTPAVLQVLFVLTFALALRSRPAH